MDAATKFEDEIAQLVATENSAQEHVYNADASALHWHHMPWKTLTQGIQESPLGSRDSKDGVAILGCTNAAETHKTKLKVNGESVHPRAFKGVKILPLIYNGNTKRWITTKFFLNGLKITSCMKLEHTCTSVGLDLKCKIFFDSIKLFGTPQSRTVNKIQCFWSIPPSYLFTEI